MRKTQLTKVFSLGIAFCLFACMTSWGADGQDDLQAASENIKNQRKLYIEKIMELPPSENVAFWRLYDEYESGLARIRAKRIELVIAFIKNQAKYSDDEALDMLDRKMKIDEEDVKYKQAYVSRFKKILPGRKVVRFYQAENRFDIAAMSGLYDNVPVIE